MDLQIQGAHKSLTRIKFKETYTKPHHNQIVQGQIKNTERKASHHIGTYIIIRFVSGNLAG